jgi:hypothetical protein
MYKISGGGVINMTLILLINHHDFFAKKEIKKCQNAD